MPDDVAIGLLDYAHRLRTSTMHTVTERTDTTGAGSTAAGCRLTYGQAVYWIDPLLTTIDQVNSQLAGIREIEESRTTEPAIRP